MSSLVSMFKWFPKNFLSEGVSSFFSSQKGFPVFILWEGEEEEDDLQYSLDNIAGSVRKLVAIVASWL